MKKPNFAYPATVAKEADLKLKDALSANDPVAALRALIDYSLSKDMIDFDNAQECIKLAVDTSERFKDSDLYGVYLCLIAKMYHGMYTSDMWMYDRRDLPMTPLPDDLTEWSGKQYRAKIHELTEQAMSPEIIARLRNISVQEYPSIIIADDLTAAYYPTLADFVYNCALEMAADGDADGIIDRAIANSLGNVASEILWKSLAITHVDNNEAEMYYQDGNSGPSAQAVKLLSLFEEYKASKYAALILDKAGGEYQGGSVRDRSMYVSIVRDYMDRVPDCMFRNALSNHLNIALNPSFRIQYPVLCSYGLPVKVSASSLNAKDCTIKVYYLGENYDKDYCQASALSGKKPVNTIKLAYDREAPFRQDTVLDITLAKTGYYVLTSDIPERTDSRKNYQVLRCIPVYPIAVTYMATPSSIIVVDPSTGVPVKGAKVQVMRKGAVLETAVTDAQGIASINYGKEDVRSHIMVTVGGKSYNFNDIEVSRRSRPKEDIVFNMANILTDRAIYHQGDEIKALGIYYRSTKGTDGKSSAELLADADVSMILRDANYQPIDTVTTKTDSYGRAQASFTVPTDRMTGMYTITAVYGSDRSMAGRKSVMVSDFKMPDYQLEVSAVECDVPSKGAVTVTGNAMTYSGMPVADANITVIVKKSDHGIWWRSEETTIYSTTVTTKADGTYSLLLPASVFEGDDQNIYSVTLTAVSSTGEAIVASEYFTLKAQYFISLKLKSNTVDGEKPLIPEVKVTDVHGEAISIPLAWALTKGDKATIASGDFTGQIDLSGVTPGAYRLTVTAKDKDLADPATASITIYNVSSSIVPDNQTLWCESSKLTVDGSNRVNVLVGTSYDNTTLYYSISAGDEVFKLQCLILKKGYHNLSFDLPAGYDNYLLKLFTVKDCNTLYNDIDISRQQSSGLKIVGESFRDNLIPSSSETWRLKVTYADGRPLEAALALDMYNKALEPLYPHSFTVSFAKDNYNNHLWLRNLRTYNASDETVALFNSLKEDFLQSPEFQLYGYGFSSFQNTRSRGLGVVYMKSAASAAAFDGMMDASIEEEAEVCEDVSLGASAPANLNSVLDSGSVDNACSTPDHVSDNVDYRESDVPLAVWAPGLSTDGEGNITYTFTVPNANTTWRLRAVAWSQDMEVGSLMRDFVASKPIMVQPNLPRFLRTGDSAVVMAAVMNNTEAADTITTTVELFDPLTTEIIKSEVFTNNIAAKQTATVSISIEAGADCNAIGYRIRSTNGSFTDGEQTVIRVLPSEASLIETQPFYLNPGDGEYVTKLPADKGARISLTFCENPVWTIVSALPGLRTEVEEYANSAAAAIFSAAISRGILNDNQDIADAIRVWLDNPNDSALVSMLQRNEDLKIALLNSTPWVQAAQSDTERMANLALMFDQKSIDASVQGAVKILSDLQRSDGGWAWGKWCDKSSVWVTSNVLGMLGSLKACGWLPQDKSLGKMIDKAVRYYDNAVEDTDIIYCLTRPYFSDISVSSNGKKVIDATVADIKKHWKRYTDPAYKSMAAMALYLNGDKDKAHQLMRSVSEFGVYTESQGLKFPSVNALYSYAIILEAYGMIEPGSKEVDGLRQQLIVRKQATDWGTAVVTSEVVKSILSTGSKWTVAAKGAEIKVGDTVIVPDSPIESATGSLTADLSAYRGDTLTITTSPAGPSYGAVYSQFSRRMDQVKASACDDLDIEKKLTVRRGTEWVNIDSLNVGDRVKVQLTIHCKRNLQYVSIVDERPAALEPVDQLPGWIWSEGAAFYRENRDAETDLHIIYMRPGTYILTYEMNVNMAGTFMSGVASIQSQYAPEISAHSSGCSININPQNR